MVGIFSHDFSIKHTTIKKERQDDRLDDPEMYPELYRKTIALLKVQMMDPRFYLVLLFV